MNPPRTPIAQRPPNNRQPDNPKFLMSNRFSLAGVEGLEPPTPGFGDRCSSQLSYTPKPLWLKGFWHFGSARRTAFAPALLPNSLSALAYSRLKGSVNERRRIDLHAPRHVRVQVQCNADARMPKAFQFF